MTPEEYIKAYTRGCSNELVGGSYYEWLTPENALAAVELAREEKKAAIKCEKKSPITGGEMQLMQEKSSVKFRGEEITFIKNFYHCVDSGQDFTDTELDNDNMWAIFRAYWERRGFEHFYDIDGYRKEQEPESEDFESEWKRYCDSKGGGAVTMNVKDVAKHFAQWQKAQDAKSQENIDKLNALTDMDKTLKTHYEMGVRDTKRQLMKGAIECEIDYDYYDDLFFMDYTPTQENLVIRKKGLNMGDKVKVIIIKG